MSIAVEVGSAADYVLAPGSKYRRCFEAPDTYRHIISMRGYWSKVTVTVIS